MVRRYRAGRGAEWEVAPVPTDWALTEALLRACDRGVKRGGVKAGGVLILFEPCDPQPSDDGRFGRILVWRSGDRKHKLRHCRSSQPFASEVLEGVRWALALLAMDR